MDAEEFQIAPPSFPLTAKLNQAATDFYFDNFSRKYLIDYQVIVTSTLRDDTKNAAVGGAENSAHLHGLAVDFILARDGKPIPERELKKVFDQIVAPRWPGFSLFEGDHIHLNLTRRITPAMTLATFSVMGIVGVRLFKLLFTPQAKG